MADKLTAEQLQFPELIDIETVASCWRSASVTCAA